MKKTLLIMTVGGTDVQLCLGNERFEFVTEEMSRLHEELRSKNAEEWSIADSSPFTKASPPKDKLPEGHITLCTPKLDAVLEYARTSALSIESVLILDTRRDPAAERKDPLFAGRVLALRLKEAISSAPPAIEFATYLLDKDRLEDRSNPLDAKLRRGIVTLVDNACRNAIDNKQPEAVLLSVSGGSPVIRDLVTEIVRLRAGKSEFLPVDTVDGTRSANGGVDRAIPSPLVLRHDELFAARRHALELVRSGNLHGAFGAVKHLHEYKLPGSSAATPNHITVWTRVLEWLARWASSLPLPSECDIALLNYAGKGKRAVRSALQVELALRAGNIPAAVHGTVAFFESALWDHLLDKVLTQHSTDGQRYAFKTHPSVKVAFPFKEPSNENGTLYYWVDTGKGGCTKLVTEYLNEPDLLRLHQAISGVGNKSPSPVRDLRNDVAHNVPTETEMERAKQVMRSAKLWFVPDPQQTPLLPPQFLCQDLVKNVLTELGITDPAKLCEKLIGDVEQRILFPS